MFIESIAKKDRKTKNLVKRLNNGEIAVISHKDIDEIAALSLVEKKPRAIINTKQSISGKYPNGGPAILLEAGITMIDMEDEKVFDLIDENSKIRISQNKVFNNSKYIGKGTILTSEIVSKKTEDAKNNLEIVLEDFIENTLEYAKNEKSLILGKIEIPKVNINIEDRHVLVVVRGKDYKKDLLAIRTYIEEVKPVLIGVDGGGDALLEFGYIPDIVIGDMDSVSDDCLKLCKEIIVHAYSNGRAPGVERIENQGLEYKLFPSPGTSEDIAMLLAYEKGADVIVAVGTHTNMIDFLEKGRKGMSSTFLVRLKIGSKLIDAKGVNKLYKERIKPIHLFSVFMSSLIPIIVIALLSPLSKQIIKLLQIRFKLLYELKGILW
ncbi:putative cytokinetic ring protein SteA [Wukongibacter sp. M2B1]|uniref:putative cytokinetic ring protein SteA n=1 Tax=Wukongibacter sp. M2B1 TaxID=3088895 RepID=UPI003D794DCC